MSSKKVKPPKNQHWVPRFYLKQFAIPDTKNKKNPQAWVLFKNEEDGEEEIINIKKLAVKNYFYSPLDKDGKRNHFMEYRLARGEAILGSIWPKIANDFVNIENGSSYRKALALFMSLLILRNPKQYQSVIDTHKALMDFLETVPKDYNGKPRINEVIHDGKPIKVDFSDFLDAKKFNDNDYKKMFVDQIDYMAREVAEMLMGKRWSIVFSEKPVFITTDNPVILVHPDIDEKHRGIGIKTKGVLIQFPISPTRTLLLTEKFDNNDGGYYPLIDEAPGSWNFVMWSKCLRYLISPRDTYYVCEEFFDSMDMFEKEKN